MPSSKELYQTLRKRIGWGAKQHWLIMLIAMVCLPALVGGMASVWTASWNTPHSTMLGLVLLLFSVVMLCLAGYVLAGERNSPLQNLADAAETQERLEQKETELARRDRAYIMVRKAFEQLNTQTCGIAEPAAGGFCSSRFCKSMSPIVQEFIRNMDVVFGVRGLHFSLEMYFYDGVIPTDGPASPHQQSSGQRQEFFHSTHAQKEMALTLGNESPVLIGLVTAVPDQVSIYDRGAVFLDQGKPKETLYFRRFATCPIPWACSGDGQPSGVLVLTSMQEEVFAPDLLETMGFLASMIANFVYRYRVCFEERRAQMQRAAATRSFQPPVRQPAAPLETQKAVPAANSSTSPPKAPQPQAAIQPNPFP